MRDMPWSPCLSCFVFRVWRLVFGVWCLCVLAVLLLPPASVALVSVPVYPGAAVIYEFGFE